MTAKRYTVKRFPEYGWGVLDQGSKVGDERGPWYSTRKCALAEATRLADPELQSHCERCTHGAGSRLPCTCTTQTVCAHVECSALAR